MILPVVGTAIGAAAGALVGTISAAITTAAAGTAQDNEIAAIETLGEAYRKDSALIAELEKAKNEGKLSDVLAEK
jgi:hypothetical protein